MLRLNPAVPVDDTNTPWTVQEPSQHVRLCHTATLTSFKEEGNKEEVNSGVSGKAGERGGTL